MKYEQILPTRLIIIDVASAIPYIGKRDAGHIIYWLAAAALNIAVTFLF